jgi:hypothetical protein
VGKGGTMEREIGLDEGEGRGSLVTEKGMAEELECREKEDALSS